MKKLVVLFAALFVLVGCSAKSTECVSESDSKKHTVKLDVKDNNVVGFEEKSVFKMDKQTQMDVYDDMYRQFSESKRIDGVTFEYEKKDDALEITTKVDLEASQGVQLEKYFSYMDQSAQKIILDQEDKNVDAIKAVLASEGNFVCK